MPRKPKAELKSRALVEQILQTISEDRERVLSFLNDIEQMREDNKDLVLLNGKLWTDSFAALQGTTTLMINAARVLQKDDLTQVILEARTKEADDEALREAQELERQLEESARIIDTSLVPIGQTISTVAAAAKAAPAIIDVVPEDGKQDE